MRRSRSSSTAVQRALFPAVSQAAARIIDLRRLRWIAFSHIEADECGALAEWLDAAPAAIVAHGAIGCAIWLTAEGRGAERQRLVRHARLLQGGQPVLPGAGDEEAVGVAHALRSLVVLPEEDRRADLRCRHFVDIVPA